MRSSEKIRRKSYALRMPPPLGRMQHRTSLISLRALNGKAQAIDEYGIIMAQTLVRPPGWSGFVCMI
jgi:hypothetical protein